MPTRDGGCRFDRPFRCWHPKKQRQVREEDKCEHPSVLTMRDERFHPKAGGFSKNTRLAFDDRPTAERLDDDSLPLRGGAPRNDDDDEKDENDDFVSSSSSDAPPPLVSALAVPSRLLARLSPRRVAERAAFRHLARAARRLDLVASMRARRAGTTRRLKRAWRVARSVAAADPTAAPALTLLATALAREAKAAETFSRLKRDARLGLRDAAARLRAFAAKNAWAAEVLLSINEEEAHHDEAEPDLAASSRRFAEDASSRLMRLSDAERRLSERAFAALAGADPRAFAPSAETLAETRLTNASKKNATRRVKRDEAAKISRTFFPKRAPTRADGDPKHAPRLSSRDVVMAMGPIRPIRPIGDETRERVSHAAAFEDGNETARGLDDSVSEDPEDPEDPEDRRRRACSWRDPEDPDCFSQSELLTSSQREAIDTGNGGHESRAARGSGSRRHDSIGGSIVSAEEKQKKNDDGDDADDADAPREINRNDVESESTETTSLPAIRATQTQSQSR